MSLRGVESIENQEINLLATIQGSQYPKRGELIVSKDFMNDTGYNVGDQVHVRFPDGEIHIMPLVGLIGDQADTGDPTSGSSAYVTMDTLEHLGQGDFYNRILVTIRGEGSDETEIAALAESLEEKVERHGRNVYRVDTTISTDHPQASMALAVFGILGVLGVLITLLSSSLIVNTLNALLVQHTRQIGVMKLIGGRSNQILGMYLALIFAYGVLALLISAPAGAIGGYALARYMASMMNVTLQGF